MFQIVIMDLAQDQKIIPLQDHARVVQDHQIVIMVHVQEQNCLQTIELVHVTILVEFVHILLDLRHIHL